MHIFLTHSFGTQIQPECGHAAGPIRVKTEAVRVAASQFLSINTPSILSLHAHSSLVTQLQHIYTVRGRAPKKETETSNKEVNLLFYIIILQKS